MNKYFYVPIFIVLLLFTSCKKNFQDTAIDDAADGQITKEEMAGLVAMIPDDSNLSGDKFYTSGRPDTLKIRNYLLDLYQTSQITISPSAIWIPGTYHSLEQPPFTLNVYLENSCSMDGYVEGNTAFKDAIYSFLGSFKTNFNGPLNLYYLNSQLTDSVINANENGINRFITALTPQQFEKRGGNRTSSDMTGLIQQVLNHINNHSASILISDFVFSPGSQVNAHNYLVHQSIGIRDELAQKLKTYDLAIEVLQLSSGFAGWYYDLYNHKTRINGNRPYYIWLIGNEEQLSQIRKSGMLSQIKGGGVTNDALFCKHNQPAITPFKILFSGKKGDFQLTNATSGQIDQAVPADGTAGEFAFELAANFGTNIEGLQFFDDTSNYQHDKNYRITVSRITDSDVVTRGYTHKIHLETKDLHKELLGLYTKTSVPNWVKGCNSENDQQINTKAGEMDKTFGFQYLIQGLYDGFYAAPKNNLVTQIKINIK